MFVGLFVVVQLSRSVSLGVPYKSLGEWPVHFPTNTVDGGPSSTRIQGKGHNPSSHPATPEESENRENQKEQLLLVDEAPSSSPIQWQGRNYSSQPITTKESGGDRDDTEEEEDDGDKNDGDLPDQKQQLLPVDGAPSSSRIQWEGRNYSSHPLTPEESEYLDYQKQQLPAEYSEITSAVCHRTLHGNLTMDKVFRFVSYYRLLGFDHIFFWYRPHIALIPRFDELKALPYVTLTKYTGGGVHDGQKEVERACLSRAEFAGNFTWAFPIDLDEFLWYKQREPIYKLIAHQLLDLDYISIGKYMYTQRHAATLERNDSGFGLDRYAFTAETYCYRKSGRPYCPTWLGRSKVLVKPSVHNVTMIHGYNNLHLRVGGTHLLPEEVHLKEWKYNLNPLVTTVRTNRETFFVSGGDQVDTHSTMESHNLTKDGLVPFYFDDKLQGWFRFVAQGCPPSSESEYLATELSES
jgi:hypothetical protein